MTTSSIIYKAAGSPPYPQVVSGTCRVCGLDGAGVPFDKWVRDTFTDHDKLLAELVHEKWLEYDAMIQSMAESEASNGLD